MIVVFFCLFFYNVVYSGKVFVHLLVLITCQIRKGSRIKYHGVSITIHYIQFALDKGI